MRRRGRKYRWQIYQAMTLSAKTGAQDLSGE
jgi:hypothetical protein